MIKNEFVLWDGITDTYEIVNWDKYCDIVNVKLEEKMNYSNNKTTFYYNNSILLKQGRK